MRRTQGQYEGAIESDKAAIETAQLQLDWCSIQSPINGRIGLRLVDPGNIISANTTNLVIINQFKPIAVYFTLPENQLPQVLKRLRQTSACPWTPTTGATRSNCRAESLLTADNQIDTTTGTDKLKAVFDNKDRHCFPTNSSTFILYLRTGPTLWWCLLRPSRQAMNGSSFVWVIGSDNKGGQVSNMQPVKVALTEGQSTILDSGPNSGDKVVVDGADRLRPGQPVTVSGQRQHSAQGAAQGGANQGSGQGSGPSSGSSLFTNTNAGGASTMEPSTCHTT